MGATSDDLEPRPPLKEKFQAACEDCSWRGPVRESQLEADRDARRHNVQPCLMEEADGQDSE